MKTYNKYRFEFMAAAVILANYIFLLVVYSRLPQLVPLKWSFTGEIIRKADKSWLFFIPLISIVAFFFDKAKGRPKPYSTLIVAIIIFMCEIAVAVFAK